MSTEENKALVRRWVEELFNEGNLEVADEIIAPDSVLHDPTLPDLPDGPEGHKRFVGLYRAAIPDAHVALEDELLAEGDRVVSRWSAHGTHQGELMGIPPTGGRVTPTGITVWRIEGGKIAETWTNYDALGMMRQIGAIPEPGQA